MLGKSIYVYILTKQDYNFTKFTIFIAENHVDNNCDNIYLWKSSEILINLTLYFKFTYHCYYFSYLHNSY